MVSNFTPEQQKLLDEAKQRFERGMPPESVDMTEPVSTPINFTPEQQKLLDEGKQKFEESLISKRTYSASEVPGEMVMNAGPSMGKFLSAIPETAALVGKGAYRMLDPTRIHKFSPDEIKTMLSVVKQLPQTMIMDRYGGWDKLKTTMAEDPIGFLADLSTVFSLGGTAGMSAGLKGAATVARVGEAMNPLNVITKPLSYAGQGAASIRGMVMPKTNAVIDAVEGQGPAVVNASENTPSFVPGSNPTAAQAASNLGLTKLSALGEDAANLDPTGYRNIKVANKDAQVGHLSKVSKTPLDLEAADMARSSASREHYSKSDQAVVQSDDLLRSLMDRPSSQEALQAAKTSAAETNRPFVIGKDQPEITVPSQYYLGNNTPGFTTIPAQTAEYPGYTLDRMKKALDASINKLEKSADAKDLAKAGEIRATRKELINWMENKIPDYKVARETHAEMSIPINQMEVGQYLKDTMAPLAGESAKLRYEAYAKALKDAPKTIKNSIGDSRFNKLEEVLSPEQMKITDDVLQDLQRQATNESMARDASRSGSPLDGGTPQIKGLFNRPISIFNETSNFVMGKVNKRAASEISASMKTPKTAAGMIDEALRAKQTTDAINTFSKGIGKGKISSVFKTTVPGTINDEIDKRDVLRRIKQL